MLDLRFLFDLSLVVLPVLLLRHFLKIDVAILLLKSPLAFRIRPLREIFLVFAGRALLLILVDHFDSMLLQVIRDGLLVVAEPGTLSELDLAGALVLVIYHILVTLDIDYVITLPQAEFLKAISVKPVIHTSHINFDHSNIRHLFLGSRLLATGQFCLTPFSNAEL